ncbi:MAG: hypothetical protein HYW23_01725 [Candidatus Aenigmarchaeota archaeon]|nr:hypothetical protein [Candidatus Aenigmarchaeota archaeon]
MTGPYVLRFGGHVGDTVEQVGIYDPLYLAWLNHAVNGYNDISWQYSVTHKQKAQLSEIKHMELSTQFKERIRIVDYKLNNFEPIAKCVAPKCKSPAEYLTVFENKYGISVFLGDVYCMKHRGSNDNPNAKLREIRFDSVGFYRGRDKKLMAESLLVCAGFSGRMTRERLVKLVDGLKLRRGASQLRLFDYSADVAWAPVD